MNPPARASRGRSLPRLAAGFLLAAVCCSVALARGNGDGDAPVEIVRAIGTVDIRTPCLPGAGCRSVYTIADVHRWLHPFLGEPFDAGKIAWRIERHYDFLGYDARAKVRLSDGEVSVEIDEAPGVVSEITADPKRLEGVLPPSLIAEEEPGPRAYVPLRSLRTKLGDPLNRERLAQDAYDLAVLGYGIVPIPSRPGEPDQVFVIARQPRLRPWKKVRDQMDASAPGAEGVADMPIDPLRKRAFSAAADYGKRDLLTVRLFYARAHLFREFDLLEVSPYLSRQLAGAISYGIPYVLPESVTAWNLFASIRLYDEFTPDRNLGGVEADEERRGGRLELGLEPFRHWGGHSLKGWGYVDRYHVSFGEFAIPINSGVVTRSGVVPGDVLNDVNLMGATLEYAYRHQDRAPDLSWLLRPTLEVATKAWGGDIAFRRVKGELRQHYAFSTGFELDARWQAGIVDRSVPVFEQFSLGGADSLRGFVRDDFLGRRFLSFQNDVWLPIPFRAFGRDSRILAALQRNLKTAITLDGGSVSFEDALDVHFARGIGLGLRYSAESSPTVVRADVAWGYWEGVTRFYPYVSITRKW